ncbi:MAG TPA: sialate O-acetylesterase, partial [Chitinophagaceae bacterium]|nr:sialate O-acetylesterase [Chitinophagaceae bacterium]
VYRNGTLVREHFLLQMDSSGGGGFIAVDTLPARLEEYRYDIVENHSTVLASADSICAGDVFILHGQSNAEAASYGEYADTLCNEFIRTYGMASEAGYYAKWYRGSGDSDRKRPGHIGQLGLALATTLMKKYQMPIAIMNGAVGGKPITYFQRNENDPLSQQSSYGRLLKRVREAHCENAIRAIIWYQGEQDAANHLSEQNYFDSLKTLYHAWKQDFPNTEQVYVFQIRAGCNQQKDDVKRIQEAQRRFCETYADATCLSTGAGKQSSIDLCHFTFTKGYALLAAQLARQMQIQLYHERYTPTVFSRSVRGAYLLNEHDVDLVCDYSVPCKADIAVCNDFYIEDYKFKPVEILKSDAGFRLHFNESLQSSYRLNYTGHAGVPVPFLGDIHGNAMLAFSRLPLFDTIGLNILSVADSVCTHPQNLPQETELAYFHDSHLLIHGSNEWTQAAQIEVFSLQGKSVFHQQVQPGPSYFSLYIPLPEGMMYIIVCTMERKGKKEVRRIKITT